MFNYKFNYNEKRALKSARFRQFLLPLFFFFRYRRNLGAAAHGENVVCVFFIG